MGVGGVNEGDTADVDTDDDNDEDDDEDGDDNDGDDILFVVAAAALEAAAAAIVVKIVVADVGVVAKDVDFCSNNDANDVLKSHNSFSRCSCSCWCLSCDLKSKLKYVAGE